MTTRKYVDLAPAATLTGSITSGATSVVVNSLTGFPASFPYSVVIDRDTASAEVILVTAAAGSTATVTRNANGLGAFSHAASATFEHVAVAQDMTDAAQHIAASTSVHGVSGAVVGTTSIQTLTNKTLSNPSITGGSQSTPTIISATLHDPIITGSVQDPAEFSDVVTFDDDVTGSGKLILPRYYSQVTCGSTGSAIVRNDTATLSDFVGAASLLVANGQDFNSLGAYVAGTPNKVQIPTGFAGQYRVGANLPYIVNTGTAVGIYFVVTLNGVALLSASFVPLGTGSGQIIILPKRVTLADGDVIELHATVQHGTASLYEPIVTQSQRALLTLEKCS